MNFKKENNLQKRIEESKKIIDKYPDRIPIIVEKYKNGKNVPNIDKKKYLVPKDLTLGQFQYVIRKRLKLEPSIAIFLFIKGTLLPTADLLSNVYDKYKDEDGFLYITYSGENTFG